MTIPKVRISSGSEADSNCFQRVESLQLTIRCEKPPGSRRMKIRNQSEIIIVRRIFDWLFYFRFARNWSLTVLFYCGWMLFSFLAKFFVYEADGYSFGWKPLELAILWRAAPGKQSKPLKNREHWYEVWDFPTGAHHFHKSAFNITVLNFIFS